MQDHKNLSEIKIEDQKIIENKELNLFESLIPVVILMGLLAYNIFFVEGQEWFGAYTNQYILLMGGLVSAAVGFFNKVPLHLMISEIWENWKSIFIPILILLLVGALAGTWLVSGIIPAMVYYGLQVLSPEIFLPASVIIAAIISIATGSSWTTSATVGIALVGIGSALGIAPGMIAGAVISGAYFGDKMSPLSDTTNLAPAMAGTDLFTHIKYMTFTTVPTIIVTLIVFAIISMNIDTTGSADISSLLATIKNTFHISPWLFLVPGVVIVMILMKTKPLIALGTGVVLAAVFAFIFQSDVLNSLSTSKFQSVMNAVLIDTNIETDNEKLSKLFSSGGMNGMLWTILLITCAMVFGGIMDAIGALAKITKSLLSVASSVFGLFASTVISCLGLNAIASDQYLALVIPGKMFKQAYEDKGLAPENLSRTLEDSGTVTSVLIPWNTCGAYQSSVLGVSVADYFVYAIFNYLSPFTTLLFAALNIKIKQLAKNKMIVKATLSDVQKLTEIALQSKALWGYSNAQLESWREDLTVTYKMFEDWNIYKYLIENEIVGFYILNRVNIRTSVLEFLFVAPRFIKQGVGKQLLDHAIEYCIGGSCAILNVLSDPNAEAFYLKHGFKFLAIRESSIPGRLLPELELEFPQNM